MRLLVAPVYEFPADPGADSSFLWASDLVAQAGELGWFSYFLVPASLGSGGLSDLRRVKLLIDDELPLPSRDLRESVLPRSVIDSFGRVEGAYPVDAVITNNAYRGFQLRQHLGAVCGPRGDQWREDLPVFVWDASSKFLGSDEVIATQENLAAHALGYATCRSILPSAFAMARVEDTVRALCGAPLVTRFIEQAVMLMVGPPCDLIDRLTAGLSRFERLSFYFGGRFTLTKGGERVVDQYIRYAMGGREASIFVTLTGGAKKLDALIKRRGAADLVRVSDGLSREDALRVMARCHVSIFWQSLKMLPSAPFEQLYAGLVVLFKDHGYEADLLPPGYPFVFKDDAECAAMLRWVCEHYDEAQERLLGVREWVRENMDRRRGIEQILAMVTEAAQERLLAGPQYRYYDDTVALLTRVIDSLNATSASEDSANSASWPMILAALSRLKNVSLLSTNSQARGIMPLTLYRTLMPPAYVDTCEGEWPVFVRRDA